MSATFANQAFCGYCQTKGTEDQKDDPCKITQEQLRSGDVIYSSDNGKTCENCGHSIFAHPNQADRTAFIETQAKAQAESQIQGFRSGKRSKSDSPNSDKSSSSGSSGSERKRIKLDEVKNQQIQDAKALIKAIDSTDTSTLCDPAVMHQLPFPSLSKDLPIDRFDLNKERKFTYMGRESLSKVESEILNNEIHARTINVYGTKGYGKSHIIAAVVVKLMQDSSKRVVFLPQARDMAKAPAPYLNEALLWAFARDDEKSQEIAELKELSDLTDWASKERFILVVDQMNSIEDDSKMAEEDKKLARATIKELFGYSQLAVYGFSANNQTMVHQQITQRSERDIRLFGGFSKKEYDEWLNHHASFKPSVFQKNKIADDTGRVPMYLSRLFQHFTTRLNVQEALEQSIAELAIECEELLMNFYDTTGDQYSNRIEAAKQLLHGEKPLRGAQFMDHRFFYVPDQERSSHAVCGIAKECLAVILRTQLGVQADAYFLSNEFTQRCLKNGNPTVKGFEAEQIAISAINNHGFNICGIKYTIEEKVYFKSSNEAVFSDQACCHYIPKPFNYKYIDSLVRVQHFKPRSKKVESIDLYAIQYTLQSYTDHKGSLEFFNQDYQPWQGTAETIQWHFVWILTKAEAMKKKTNPKVHGQERTWTRSDGSKMDFREWFFCYGDVVDGLKDL